MGDQFIGRRAVKASICAWENRDRLTHYDQLSFPHTSCKRPTLALAVGVQFAVLWVMFGRSPSLLAVTMADREPALHSILLQSTP